MAELAACVGLTRQSIYVHFGSRAGLLIALVRRADDRADIQAQLRTALAKADPIERLDAFLSAWLDFIPMIYPVAGSLIRSKRGDADAAAAWNDRMSELLAGFKQLSSGLRRDGVLAVDWTVPKAAEYLWSGSSVQMWELLVVERGWTHRRASAVLRRTLADVVLRS